jgi:hypothetical protein
MNRPLIRPPETPQAAPRPVPAWAAAAAAAAAQGPADGAADQPAVRAGDDAIGRAGDEPAVRGGDEPAVRAGRAAFAAGAALAALDPIAREPAPWAGVWRRRLALAAARGRDADAAAIRDAFYLRRPADDPGPAGRRLVAWRALVGRPAGLWPQSFLAAAAALGVKADAAGELVEAAQEIIAAGEPAPFAAARVAASAWRRRPDPQWLGLWLADAVLAERLKWPFALPLLAAPPHAPGARAGGGGDPSWTAACCLAYARAATEACRLAADLSRRADRLLSVAPKLRAKPAAAIVAALLDDDALTASSGAGGMTDRNLRRLFDRLVSLEALRELTGREAFRIYGL